MSNMMSVGGAAPTAPSLPNPPNWLSGQTGKLPNEVVQSAAKAQPTVKPVYHGPHINSVPHVASSLGAGLAVNQGGVFVNGQRINATRYVNGVPHAPVQQIAHAAGYPPTHVTSTQQTTTVMPHNTAAQPLLRTGSNGTDVRNLQQELMQMGYNVGPTGADGQYGSHTADAVRKFQADHHLGTDGVVGPQTWAALNSYHNSAPKHSTAASPTNAQASSAPSSAPAQPTDPLSQVLQGNPTLQSILGTMPQAPQQVQMPTAPNLQPFQWDGQQAYNSAYNQLAPTYMNQMSMADQKLNAGLNNRNIFNSGIAQQMQNQQDQGIYDKLDNAAMTQAQNNQKQAFTQWNDQTTQMMNDYKAQIQSAYDQGRINDQQYTEAVNQWNDAAKYLQDMYDQNQAMQKALIPYTMGPTPYQQLTLQEKQAQDVMRQEQITGYAEVNGKLVPTLDREKLDATTANQLEKATEARMKIGDTQTADAIKAAQQVVLRARTELDQYAAKKTPMTDPNVQRALQEYQSGMDTLQSIMMNPGGTSSNP